VNLTNPIFAFIDRWIFGIPPYRPQPTPPKAANDVAEDLWRQAVAEASRLLAGAQAVKAAALEAERQQRREAFARRREAVRAGTAMRDARGRFVR